MKIGLSRLEGLENRSRARWKPGSGSDSAFRESGEVLSEIKIRRLHGPRLKTDELKEGYGFPDPGTSDDSENSP